MAGKQAIDDYNGYGQKSKNRNDYKLHVHLQGLSDIHKQQALSKSEALRTALGYVRVEEFGKAIDTLKAYRMKLSQTFLGCLFGVAAEPHKPLRSKRAARPNAAASLPRPPRLDDRRIGPGAPCIRSTHRTSASQPGRALTRGRGRG